MRRWAMVILLIFASGVEALELPSEIDLRAAYCLPIVEDLVNGFQSGINEAKDAVDKAEQADMLSTAAANLHRLQLYLVPRMEHLDLMELTIAQKRGKADLSEITHCWDQCELLMFKPAESSSCHNKCNNSPLLARIQACSKLSWLPF